MRIKNIINYKITEELFCFTRQTYTKWKQENRPIINLIEKYLNEIDILQFLTSNKIDKFERANQLAGLEDITKLSLREKHLNINYQAMYLLVKFLHEHKVELDLNYKDLKFNVVSTHEAIYTKETVQTLHNRIFQLLEKSQFNKYYNTEFNDNVSDRILDIGHSIEFFDKNLYQEEFAPLEKIVYDYSFEGYGGNYDGLILFLKSLNPSELYYFLSNIDSIYKNDFETQIELVKKYKFVNRNDYFGEFHEK